MTRNDLRSQSLDLLRFPLAVVVITSHVMFFGSYRDMEGSPFLNGLFCLISGMIEYQSVPIYYFISGYVFFLNITLTKDVYLRKLHNRTKSLLIPYLTWNAIAVLKILLLALPCFAFLFNNQVTLANLDLSPRAFLMSFWDKSYGIMPSPPSETGNVNPQNVPMWFVRDLIVIVLCAPMVYRLLNAGNLRRKACLTLLCAAWFVCGLYRVEYISQLLTGFFFFSLGADMSIRRKDMMQVFGRFFKPAAVAYAVLSVVCACLVKDSPGAANAFKMLNQCAGLIVAYNVASLLIRKKVCKVSPFLASSSFFLYVSHWLVFNEIGIIMMRIVGFDTPAKLFSCRLLAVAVTVISLLALFYLLRKYCPRLLKVIAGRK